jgi:peroxiredoxin
MKAAHKLDFPVLSDAGNAYARQMNLVHGFPDDLRAIYEQFGIVLPAFNGDESWTLPLATRIVVDPGGTIRHLHTDPDYTTRPEVEETVQELAKLG